MSIDSVLRGCSETYVRLFDHRPVLSAEINYTLTEFETNRNDRELANCRAMVQQCRDTDEAIDTVDRILKTDYPALLVSIQRCTKALNCIASEEKDDSAEPVLSEKAIERSERWLKFLEEQTKRTERVDHWFEEEKKKLEKTYEELEDKLCSSP